MSAALGPLAEALPPRLREPRNAGPLVAALALAAGAFGWAAASGSRLPEFPRRESEFVVPERRDASLRALEDHLKDSPDDLRSLVQAGVLRFQRGSDDYPEAINLLEEARKLGAADPRLFYYLGVMYQAEGLYPFATQEYRRFLRNRPDDREVRLLLAKLLFLDSKAEEALGHYEALRRAAKRADPIVDENAALCLLTLKRSAEAALLLESLLARGGETARRARLRLGLAALEGLRWSEAREHLLAVLPLDGRPDLGVLPATVHAGLAAAHEKLGELDGAKASWEEAARLDSKDAKIRSSLRAATAALKKRDRESKKKTK